MSLFSKLQTTASGQLQLIISGGPGQFSFNVLLVTEGSVALPAAHFYNRVQTTLAEINYSIVKKCYYVGNTANDISWYSFHITLAGYTETPYTLAFPQFVRPYKNSNIIIKQGSDTVPNRVYRTVIDRESANYDSFVDVTDPVDYCATMMLS